jgi:hypothetical protein
MQPNLPFRATASVSFLKRKAKPLIEGFAYHDCLFPSHDTVGSEG